MTNLERMIRLANEFFSAKSDPNQVSVTQEVMEQLRRIHPATMREQDDGDGPVAWVLVIPTTEKLMKRFIAKEINEDELLKMTPLNGTYEAIYLCSALVLPEFRGRGIAKRLLCEAVKAIRQDHPIRYLFYWAFSSEGEKLAEAVSRETAVSLYKKEQVNY
ncbi:MAG: GNAT family N-acetyltransferase [Bacteroidota bacterium]|nr:GNAT family N-acetyltransferase [Bacteroidota bacterium]